MSEFCSENNGIRGRVKSSRLLPKGPGMAHNGDETEVLLLKSEP